ncbi:hypothetical protein ZIOFF_052811 [Zingiber officinale]|uniref:TRF2/HOY1 PH-like domain-containing protein n=1 Tax=Zingiber officinale TaxID=94328 RepID=A0A8J5KIZ9_ZINOF|nr:hypothetical protein ZIOFF_052811 [Zingiber officinale]
MDWSSVSSKRRADSTSHSAPPPPAGKLEVEEPLYEKRVIPAPDTTLLQAVYNNLLGEPEPLDLRLRKSPSIHMMLSQSKAGKNLCVTSSKGSKVGVKSNSASSSSLSKIKASHFNASLLRIGTWEGSAIGTYNPLPNWLTLWRSSLCSIGKQFVTRYEGDLMAKCYFAKRKLLWEFLEGGVKSKIEFHWSDITAIKAVFFDSGYGALDIVLARPPLFFREIDPQPRKHIQWQATQDFTNGQAHIHRRHLLQCPQTSLSKNFEKLINCDPHLKLLSQQPDIILESPYFDPLLNQQPDIILESPYFDPLLSQQPDIILESPYFDPLLSQQPDIILESPYFDPLFSQQPDIILESPYFDPQYLDILLASPYFDPQYSVLDGQSDFKSHINDVIKDDTKTTFSGFYEPGPPCATSSISNKTETQNSFWRTPAFDSQCTPSPCLGNNISSNFEELASGNTSLPCDALFDENFISQLLDFDFQPPSAASDEQSNIPKVNSRCCLLQQDTVVGMTINAQLNDQDGSADDAQAGAGSYNESYSTPEPEQSFLEFMKIPRIASFPRMLWQLLLNGRKAKLSFGTAIPPPLLLQSTYTLSKRKSCGETTELGVLRFLLWISSGGMIWSSVSGKRRADSTPHSAPLPPAGKLEMEEPLYKKRVRLHKRARDTSTSSEQVDPLLSLLIMFVSLSDRFDWVLMISCKRTDLFLSFPSWQRRIYLRPVLGYSLT